MKGLMVFAGYQMMMLLLLCGDFHWNVCNKDLCLVWLDSNCDELDFVPLEQWWTPVFPEGTDVHVKIVIVVTGLLVAGGVVTVFYPDGAPDSFGLLLDYEVAFPDLSMK